MKIALAHPQRLVREAVRRSLMQADLALIWTAVDGRELDRMWRRDPPDLLLLDASLLPQQHLLVDQHASLRRPPPRRLHAPPPQAKAPFSSRRFHGRA